MGDTSRVRLGYVEEVTWGVTPAGPPTLNLVRLTNENLGQPTEFTSSNEIRPDRQVADMVRTKIMAQGDVGFELSYGAFDDFLSALLADDWATDGGGAGIDRLENGVILKSFSMEKEFTDINEFVAYTGMRIATGSVNIEPDSIVTGQFSFLGKSAVASGSTIGDGTPSAAPTNDVVNAIDHIGAVNEGGGAFGGYVLGLNFEVSNNARDKPAVANLGPIDIGFGRSVITGSFQTYFEDRTLYSKYLGDTPSSLSFEVTDSAGNKYTITFPKIKYIDGNPETPGNDDDTVLEQAFQAYRDPTTGVTIRIDRDPV